LFAKALEPHVDFRLWLTTEQHGSFPPIILQQSLKTTFEAPPGVRKNLTRTYESLMVPEFVEKGTPQRAQLLLVLAWFHAVLQVLRRTLKPTHTHARARAHTRTEDDARAHTTHHARTYTKRSTHTHHARTRTGTHTRRQTY